MAKEIVTRIGTEVVGSVIRFAFPTFNTDADGKQQFRRVEVDTKHLPSNVLDYAAIHGIKQKLSDAMALGMITEDGRVRRPTMADKLAEFSRVLDNLGNGVWNEVREGPTGGILYQAMLRVYPGKFEDAAGFRAWLDEQATAKKVKVSAIESALRVHPKIAPVIEEIKAAMGKSAVDADSMLDELEAE